MSVNSDEIKAAPKNSRTADNCFTIKKRQILAAMQYCNFLISYFL